MNSKQCGLKITKEEPITEKGIIDLRSRTSAGSKITLTRLLMTVKISAITHLEWDHIINFCNCPPSRIRFILENGKKLGALTLSGHFQKYAKPGRNQKS